ncbi:hypothetical protein LINPERPRIM_LOCUS20463 [Linum perenne]
MNLGWCSITRAEMRGSIEGLRRTWEVGFRRVIFNSIPGAPLLSSQERMIGFTNMEWRRLNSKSFAARIGR